MFLLPVRYTQSLRRPSGQFPKIMIRNDNAKTGQHDTDFPTDRPISFEAPSVGTGSERKVKWVFEGKSETNSKLLLPLSGSLVFKKLGAEDEEGNKVNVKAAMKAEIKNTIESGLQSLGLSVVIMAMVRSENEHGLGRTTTQILLRVMLVAVVALAVQIPRDLTCLYLIVLYCLCF